MYLAYFEPYGHEINIIGIYSSEEKALEAIGEEIRAERWTLRDCAHVSKYIVDDKL
jgi:hypothetical protein